MKQQFSLLPKIAALSIAAAFAAPAMAQTAGSNIVNLGWVHLAPQDSSEPIKIAGTALPNSGATVGTADTLGISLTHFFTDNFALTADGGLPPKYTLKATGSIAAVGEAGTAKSWSPAVVAKWYFGDGNSKFRPFVGAGVAYVWYSDVELSGSLQRALSARISQGASTAFKSTADLSSSFAPVFNLGATYNFDQNWSLGFSVAYIPLKTNADITTTTPTGPVKSTSSLTLNPIVSYLSVGYKF